MSRQRVTCRNTEQGSFASSPLGKQANSEKLRDFVLDPTLCQSRDVISRVSDSKALVFTMFGAASC